MVLGNIIAMKYVFQISHTVSNSRHQKRRRDEEEDDLRLELLKLDILIAKEKLRKLRNENIVLEADVDKIRKKKDKKKIEDKIVTQPNECHVTEQGSIIAEAFQSAMGEEILQDSNKNLNQIEIPENSYIWM